MSSKETNKAYNLRRQREVFGFNEEDIAQENKDATKTFIGGLVVGLLLGALIGGAVALTHVLNIMH